MEQADAAAPQPQELQAAQTFIASSYGCTLGAEWINLDEAQGRILAEDVVAASALPRFAASAMDGFAVRDADLADGCPAMLRIAGIARAGHPFPRPLEPGQAVRIFTGAPVPAGADRVIMQEDCRIGSGVVTLETAALRKRHIRHSGEDVREGQFLLPKGTRLTAAHLSLLAALQVERVRLLRPLKVALLSTGDELRPLGQPLGAAQIIDTNGPYLRRQLLQRGCLVDDRGIIPDDAEALMATLVSAAADNDLVLTSGGASVGAEDHLKQLVRKRGYLEFWRLRMKPGKPVGLGDVDDCPILILPGNPVAAAVAFHFLGHALIAALSGDRAHFPTAIRLPLAVPARKTTDRLEILAARVVAVAGGLPAVDILPVQGSASLLSLALAEGWVQLPAGEAAQRSGFVDYFPMGF